MIDLKYRITYTFKASETTLDVLKGEAEVGDWVTNVLYRNTFTEADGEVKMMKEMERDGLIELERHPIIEEGKTTWLVVKW